MPTGVHFKQYLLGTKLNRNNASYIFTAVSQEQKYFEYNHKHEEFVWLKNYTDQTVGPTEQDFLYSAT
jgi:hypothetical protein